MQTYTVSHHADEFLQRTERAQPTAKRAASPDQQRAEDKHPQDTADGVVQ